MEEKVPAFSRPELSIFHYKKKGTSGQYNFLLRRHLEPTGEMERRESSGFQKKNSGKAPAPTGATHFQSAADATRSLSPNSPPSPSCFPFFKSFLSSHFDGGFPFSFY